MLTSVEMKKIALLIVAITCVCMLQAQQGLKIGVRVGPTFTSTTILDATTKTVLDVGQSGGGGWTLGIVANQGFSDNYAFQTGASVVKKSFSFTGTIATSDSTTGEVAVTNNITSFEVPLGLKLVTNEIGNGLSVMGRFGMTLDLNLGFRQTQTVGTEEPVANQQGNQINKIGSTIFAGAGVQYEKDWGTMVFDISYHHGLVNVNNRNNTAELGLGNASIRLSYVAIGATYFF